MSMQGKAAWVMARDRRDLGDSYDQPLTATLHHRPGKRTTFMKWTPDEVVCLLQGVRSLGVGYWTQILLDGAATFQKGRTSVDLKDKYRGLVKNGTVDKASGKIANKDLLYQVDKHDARVSSMYKADLKENKSLAKRVNAIHRAKKEREQRGGSGAGAGGGDDDDDDGDGTVFLGWGPQSVLPLKGLAKMHVDDTSLAASRMTKAPSFVMGPGRNNFGSLSPLQRIPLYLVQKVIAQIGMTPCQLAPLARLCKTFRNVVRADAGRVDMFGMAPRLMPPYIKHLVRNQVALKYLRMPIEQPDIGVIRWMLTCCDTSKLSEIDFSWLSTEWGPLQIWKKADPPLHPESTLAGVTY